jgi:hypothetical protein
VVPAHEGKGGAGVTSPLAISRKRTVNFLKPRAHFRAAATHALRHTKYSGQPCEQAPQSGAGPFTARLLTRSRLQVGSPLEPLQGALYE